MNRFIAMIMAAVMITAIFIQYKVPEVYAEPALPVVEGEAALLMDAKSGEILYDKNMNELFEPASTTKMITCILALENLKQDEVITIDSETEFTEGSRIYLQEGEKMSVKDLLHALMLESANDAAVALAKAVSGSTEEFSKLMNKKAKQIGAKKPQFVNPNGLHEEGHLASAYDLAMIAKYGMQNKEFRKLVSTYKYQMSATNIRPERTEVPMYNTNRLLYDKSTKMYVNGVLTEAKYKGTTGIKTGYTSSAGGCLVASAKKDGTELIAVVLKSSNLGRFSDCVTLLEYGFGKYHTALAIEKNADLGEVAVKRGAVSRVKAVTTEAAYVTLPIEASSSVVKTKVVLDKKVKAPLKKGDKVGKIEIYEGDTLRGYVDAVAKESIEKGTFLSVIGIGNNAAYAIFAIAAILLSLAAVMIGANVTIKNKRDRRRKELRAKRALEIAKKREIHKSDHDSRDWYF
ncbi:MAG: D-alanyl-D-alanine carboxypeptidase [Eubacteriales bacterium]|nr:D-alanyl-D-alanine carboxypeptidase [Eubacteriales bacterium]MDD4390001.1 D-alanyl-D-alanine carboxypeptidase [Eubacteriales bacterium]